MESPKHVYAHQLLADYFDGFTGSADWKSLQPVFDAAFHPDLVVVTAEGERSREQWVEAVQGLLQEQTTASEFEVVGEDDDAVYYRIKLTKRDGSVFHPTGKGTLEDGQFVRVEPDPESRAKGAQFFRGSS